MKISLLLFVVYFNCSSSSFTVLYNTNYILLKINSMDCYVIHLLILSLSCIKQNKTKKRFLPIYKYIVHIFKNYYFKQYFKSQMLNL